MRRAAQYCLMRFNRRNEQIRIVGSARVDLVIDDDLIFGFLPLDHLAELVGLGRLALADDLRRWLEQAEELAFKARLAAEDARSRLLHHLPDERNHRVDLPAQAVERQLLQDLPRPL